MDSEHLEYARIEKKRVERQLRQLEMPVDFDKLCEDGVLERAGAKRFRVRDLKRLPDHAVVRLEMTQTIKTTMKGSAKRTVTERTAKLLSEAAVKRKLLRINKLLDQIIELQRRS